MFKSIQGNKPTAPVAPKKPSVFVGFERRDGGKTYLLPGNIVAMDDVVAPSDDDTDNDVLGCTIHYVVDDVAFEFDVHETACEARALVEDALDD